MRCTTAILGGCRRRTGTNLLDGQAGVRADSGNLPDHDEVWWAEYVATLKHTAENAG